MTMATPSEHAEVQNGTEQATQTTNADQEPTISMEEQLKKALAERDEYREISIRKVAELENFRKRSEQERGELIAFGNHKLLLRLLPVLDDLQRAVENGKSSTDYKSLLEGIELVYNKTMQTFEEAGVKPMKSLGEMFDVKMHEALMQMPSEAPEGQILQEAQRGYLYGEKVLRHAKVIVSAGMPDNAGEQAA
jgi:molecular chaperone GrpE